jgi:PKD repeat protein
MWAWDFGDGATATGVTADHVYATAGVKTITLTVTDSQTLSDSELKSVEVFANPPPVASFTWSVSGQTVSVDGLGSTDDRPIASYAWDFGDGGTATGATASHTYVKPVLSTHVVLASPGLLVPQPPYSLVGFTYASDGVTPMTNSVVTITNGRTGDVINCISDPDYGIILSLATYSYPDLANEFLNGVLSGDTITVAATNGEYSGTATGTANLAAGSIYLDVILTGGPPPPVFVDYTITLTVTDSEGLTDSMKVTVTIEFPGA